MRNIFIVLVMFSMGCSQQPKQSIEISKTEQSNKESSNKIIFLNDYYSSYINAIKAGKKESLDLCKEKIQKPIIDKYFLRSEFLDLVKEDFSLLFEDTMGLEVAISLIQLYKKKIEEIILATLLDCNQYLQNDSLTIFISPTNSNSQKSLEKMGGVTGLTAGSKQILLVINPNSNSWEESLKQTIAHEFHHAYWTKKHLYKITHWTLLEYLIFEGKADSFAHLLYPTINAPWTSALSAKEKKDLWSRIKPELQNENLSFQQEVMFGSKTYPIWGGYTIGFDIVQSALKQATQLSAFEWTNLDAKKVFEKSEYK